MKNFDAELNVKHLVNFIQSYFKKNGNSDTKAIIGISGGKDSTVATALLVKALGKERVIGVLMPNGEQRDIDAARKVVNYYDICHYTINIGDIVNTIYDATGIQNFNDVVKCNTPPRVRMTMLYALANQLNGRVCNTSNYSEWYVGYYTKWGDMCGDFSLFCKYHATDVIAIGKALSVPEDLLYKAPEDGLTGKTDEENFGFEYAELDNYLDGEPDNLTDEQRDKIRNMHSRAEHKNGMTRWLYDGIGSYAVGPIWCERQVYTDD